MQTTMVLTQKIIIFRQVTRLLRSGNTKGLSWTYLYTNLATISRGAIMYLRWKRMRKRKFLIYLFCLFSLSSVCCWVNPVWLKAHGCQHQTSPVLVSQWLLVELGSNQLEGEKFREWLQAQLYPRAQMIMLGICYSIFLNSAFMGLWGTQESSQELWAYICLVYLLSHHKCLTGWEPYSLRKRWMLFP